MGSFAFKLERAPAARLAPPRPYVSSLRVVVRSLFQAIRRREQMAMYLDVVEPAMSESEHVERDRERPLLGVLGASRDAGGEHPGSDLDYLALVVLPQRGVEPPDFLTVVLLTGGLIVHGATILRPARARF
jgi:hypothetical protein